MYSRVISLVALLPMLLHSILGCCWHHAHPCGCEVDGARAVCQAGFDSSNHEHVGDSACPSHRTSQEVESSSELPDDPCRHFPCDEERCSFVNTAATVAQQSIDLELAWISVLLAYRDLSVPHDSMSTVQHSCCEDVPRVNDGERRALTQVWLI